MIIDIAKIREFEGNRTLPPYGVSSQEEDGSKTMYFSSAPIFGRYSRSVIDMNFYKTRSGIISQGSNCEMIFADKIFMKNDEGSCTVDFHKKISADTQTELTYSGDKIRRTTNGFIYQAQCNNSSQISFTIEAECHFMQTRTNKKYFAIMRDQFKPFITISPIGATGQTGQIISPLIIKNKKISEKAYEIVIKSYSRIGKWMMFEINLYETKIFQDTTVESKHPKSNNAYGGVGFIGNTTQYGEQWLYIRPDFSRLPEISNKHINKVYLHIPRLNNSNTELCATALTSRFCSFGSNWNNKVQDPLYDVIVTANTNYYSLDITAVVKDRHSRITATEGFIVKARHQQSGFAVIATGDNYNTPVILEVNYKT